MKTNLLMLGAAMMALVSLNSCGMLSGSTAAAPAAAASAPVATAPAVAAPVVANSAAAQYGQGAGLAMINLYKQYKADGKFDAANTNNIINSLQLIANCSMLKENYKDKAFMADYNQGLIMGAAGLINTSNVNNVVNSLTSLATTAGQNAANSAASTIGNAVSSANTAVNNAVNTTNNALSQASSSVSNVLGQAATVAQSASSITNLLSLFAK